MEGEVYDVRFADLKTETGHALDDCCRDSTVHQAS